MKLKFYGTAAAEGIPAPFCTCKVCEHARAFGGKNIRTRHLSTIDDDIQMDIGPDFFWHTVHNGLDAMRIRHLILTHSHGDHMDKLWINNRAHPYSLTGAQRINLVAGKKVLDVLALYFLKDDNMACCEILHTSRPADDYKTEIIISDWGENQ